MLETWSRRGGVHLSVLQPPLELFHGVLPDPDTTRSCDARHYVHVTVGADDGERAYVHALPE